MKKLIYIFFLLFTFLASAQIIDPVKWTSKVEKKSDTEYVLVFDAVIEEHWHMYSQFSDDMGGLPMIISFNNAEGNYKPAEKAQESETKTEYSDIFEVDETFFEHTAQLKHPVTITNADNTIIQVTIDYQVCKESCIQGQNLFEFDVKTLTSKEVKNFEEPAVNKGDKKDTTPATGGKTDKEEQKGLWTIFIIAFFSGFAALLTPCVFPMIPMTVSFFTKQSKTRAAGIKNAIIYGVSIIIVYVVLGSLVTAIFGSEALNELSTSVIFNLVFFVLLLVFAFSFLGAFEIMLPNSWANKVDRQADRGGIIGILFMALALAIVSFSCTGIIVGTLLVEAASRGGIAPIVGMLGFSLALALPFMLFAMFPGWLNTLPKSGGWLNTVKVFLGFLELAFAFKFLSNADLVLQLHILERETFLAIWIAVFGALALYLFGKITLPHDSVIKHISVGRLMLGLLVLSFTVYLVPGLWGAPLKLISGFPPSPTYSESPFGFGGTSGGAAGTDVGELPEGGKIAAHGLISFEDYEKGLKYAKEMGKPVLIDFTGYACVNCRKMEDNVWSNESILSILKEDIVLISLYVDYKKELPESEQYTSETTGKKIKTIGNKWSDLQIKTYKANAQPFYVIVDHKNASLSAPSAYNPNIEEYYNWLQSGIKNFKK